MDCNSCGSVNAPGRRYCRECGGRLGRPCPVCHFFNGLEDKHCGGCGRRLKAAAPSPGVEAPLEAPYAPALTDDMGFAEEEAPLAAATMGPALAGQGVSQSEIDGLFENILDEDEGSEEGGA